MTTFPAQIKNHAAQPEKSKIVDLFNPFEQIDSFFSFRYNHTSITQIDGKTHIRVNEERFENGRYESEKFEGITGGDIYKATIHEMNKTWINMMSSLLKPMLDIHASWFPRIPGKGKGQNNE